MRQHFRLVGLFLGLSALPAITGTAAAQQMTYTITGVAKDAEGGAALPGVRVTVRGTRYTALTNAAGAYSIVVPLAPGRYAMDAQSIGRETGSQDITLGADRVVTVPDFVMRAVALSLEEVVVTGTAAPTERRALGNAVASIAEEQIAASPATTIDQAFQGMIAGAVVTSNTGTPGGGVSVRLRGTSSIVGGAEPLYIVDGVIIDNNADQQINLGYRSNSSNRLADLDPNDIERVEIVKGAAAAALYGSRANNGVVQIFTKHGRAGASRVTLGTRMTRSDLERRIPFALTPVDLTGNPVPRYDPQGLIFREPWSNDSYASISGGSSETQYYISGNFVDQLGIMRGSEYQKLNVRMNLDQRVSSWLNLSAGANYIRSHNDLVINGENGTGGLLTAIVFTPTTVDLAARDSVTGELTNKLSGTFENPLLVLDTWKSPQDINRFVGSVGLSATPLSGLSLSYRLGYDQYGMETGLTIPRGDPITPLGSATDNNRRNMLVNNDVAGNYDFRSGASLHFTTSAGMNHTYQRLDQLNASSTDLPPLIGLVRGAVQSASQARIELVTLGFYAQQQAAYRDRLYLTGALRWDASSTFGKDQRWQLFPKVSGSWVVSEAQAVKDALPWLSELRLRGALGYAGNQPPLSYAYERATRYTTITNINRLGLAPTGSPGNPDLKPERQREWEAGVDLALLNNRIGARFTYYDQYVTDLLLTRTFTPSAGYSSVLDNVGELSNKGLELEINTINVNAGSFGWSSRLIYSRNKNRVEKLVVTPFQAGYTNLVIEGQPVGVHFVPAYMRDANGQILVDSIGPLLEGRLGNDSLSQCITKHTCLASSTRRVVGDPWPAWTGSLFNELRLGKSLTASFLLDGSFGARLWNQTQRIQDIFGAGPLYDQLLKGEVTAAERTRLQSIWERYLESASYVKLRDVTLRYGTDAGWLRRIGAQHLELELAGHNLVTWTDYTGYDPEVNMFGLNTVERGTDFAVYPNARTIGIGIRLSY
jgi:TonB-linked SusC/RagA family outer membrane protein